jgi:hypothetical protein
VRHFRNEIDFERVTPPDSGLVGQSETQKSCPSKSTSVCAFRALASSRALAIFFGHRVPRVSGRFQRDPHHRAPPGRADRTPLGLPPQQVSLWGSRPATTGDADDNVADPARDARPGFGFTPLFRRISTCASASSLRRTGGARPRVVAAEVSPMRFLDRRSCSGPVLMRATTPVAHDPFCGGSSRAAAGM